MNVQEWFAAIRRKYASEMQCGKGCTACCYGLFDITLGDAVAVAGGFQKLHPDVQSRVYARAADLHRRILELAPEAAGPALFAEDDPAIDRIVDAAGSPPCPFLGAEGECLIYEHRPLACRLEGIPMVDVHDGLFGDWCELNFQQGVPESAQTDLKQDYAAMDASQLQRSSDVARQAGLSDPHAVSFIPCVVADYESFWKNLAI